jgi:hypothetical protein
MAFAIAAYRFGWVFEGGEAIAAVGQVRRGFDYAEARAGMEFWQSGLLICQFLSGIFFGLFLFTTFNKKNKKQTT